MKTKPKIDEELAGNFKVFKIKKLFLIFIKPEIFILVFQQLF
jgi:hypothetical protein